MRYIETPEKVFGPVKPGEIDLEFGLSRELVISPSGQRRIRGTWLDGEISFYLEMEGSPQSWQEVLSISCLHQPGRREEGILFAAGFIPFEENKLKIVGWETRNKYSLRQMMTNIFVTDEARLDLKELTSRGYPQLGKGESLPATMDVKKAVEFWLGMVKDYQQNPLKLDQLIFDIPKTVGRFAML